MITEDTLEMATGEKVGKFEVDGLGVAASKRFPRILTFLDDVKFLKDVNENENIQAVLVRAEYAELVKSGVVILIVDDPKWYFFSLLNYMARNRVREKTTVSVSAKIHASAVISEMGVIIEDDVIIEPNVTIMQDVIIKRGTVIRAGAVIGVDGYEHKHTSRGVLSVEHDGKVVVGEDVEIGVNSNVAKGFSYRDTVIGNETKLDGLVHYAHGAQCGQRCMIVAAAMIAGHVTIGDEVWIGPSSAISNRVTIGDRAYITLGSVVVKDVEPGAKVTGNFAIPHMKFIRNLKASVK